jgi:hypothetical protein
MGLPRICRILKELPFGGEDNQGHLSIAKHRDLMGFLQQSRPSLGEGDLPVDLVLDPFQLNPSSPHNSPYCSQFCRRSLTLYLGMISFTRLIV